MNLVINKFVTIHSWIIMRSGKDIKYKGESENENGYSSFIQVKKIEKIGQKIIIYYITYIRVYAFSIYDQCKIDRKSDEFVAHQICTL